MAAEADSASGRRIDLPKRYPTMNLAEGDTGNNIERAGPTS